jgi:hypothetical protein
MAENTVSPDLRGSIKRARSTAHLIHGATSCLRDNDYAQEEMTATLDAAIERLEAMTSEAGEINHGLSGQYQLGLYDILGTLYVAAEAIEHRYSEVQKRGGDQVTSPLASAINLAASALDRLNNSTLNELDETPGEEAAPKVQP